MREPDWKVPRDFYKTSKSTSIFKTICVGVARSLNENPNLALPSEYENQIVQVEWKYRMVRMLNEQEFYSSLNTWDLDEDSYREINQSPGGYQKNSP